MNITELDNYRLSDAIKFHDRLNPRLWDDSEHLRADVKEKLLEIAADFQEFLGVPDLDVKDITVSGSNAAYNYTPSSDIDLHLIVDLPEADRSEVFRELFDAKKYQYNDMHNIKIGGYDVELYVQDPHQEHHSQGIYSLLKNNWISVPKRRKPEIDDVSVRSKAEDLAARIDDAVKSNDYNRIADLHKKIKAMRQSGLEQQGEYGSDNLAFKVLRNQGYIKKLIDARNFARDLELSLAEMNKPKQRVRYGFFEDNTGMAQGSEDGDTGAQSSWDGVSPDTQGFLSETEDHSDLVHDFILDTADKLGIDRLPRIEIHHDPKWSQENKSFGMYQPESHTLHVSLSNRHLLDVLRTTAHELAHCAQHQQEALPDNAGDTGSKWENEAHAVAGVIMRDYADKHPELFLRQEIDEGIMSKAGAAAALAAAMAMTPAQAQDYLPQDQQQQVQQQGQLNPVQVLNIARTLYRLKHNVTRSGAEEELNQEFKNYIRAQQGDPGAQNQSRVWQMQQRRQQQPQEPWTGNQYQRESVRESSGYIPTEKEKNDPRFKMALTVDVHPGQTGREANKMSLKTNSQGKPALLMKTANLRESAKLDKPELTVDQLAKKHKVSVDSINQQLAKGVKVELEHTSSKATAREIALDHLAEFPDYYDRLEKAEANESLVRELANEFALLENEFLGEIRMSTSSLRQEAAKTGAQAGMEFEMIVPNVQADDPEPEWERDEDQDRRARSFDDIEEFFYDGDYNGRGDVRRLLDALREDFENWKMERVADDWQDEGFDFLRDYIANNDEFDREEAIDTARDEVIDANPDLPPESEDFQQLLRTRLDEMEEAFVQETWDQGIRGISHLYDRAFEEFVQEKGEDMEESDFLEETVPYMSDVESNYDIQWPYYYDINQGRGGDMSVDDVANDFEAAIGKPINASTSYHGARREPGTYVVEPDGSLEGDSPDDGGLEFVSPPMPIDELLSDLNKVKEWASSYGCYTNDSTGLHINISVPNYSLEKLDYVKLALLMGDEYVLDLFGRTGNHYAKAATGKIRDALKKNPDLAPALMDKMRGHMEDLATKAVHSGITDKYTSINTKSGYIEFRSPGGDWLDANFDKIENTLLRFTVALSAAINPEAYRKEYLKKLYKLLEQSQPKGGVDVLQLFTNYSAGELDKAGLIRQVRQSQLARGVAKGKVSGPMWWEVTNPANNAASIEVVANNKQEAIASAVLPGNYPEWARVQNTLQARPLRPYTPPAAKATQAAATGTGNWGIWITSSDRFAREPGTYTSGQEIPLRRFPSQEAGEAWLADWRQRNIGVRRDLEVREIPADYVVPPPAGRAYNPNQAQQFQEPNANRGDLTPRGPGPWEIYRLSDNSSVRELSNTDRTAAGEEARQALGLRGEAPELYGVRTRQAAQSTQPQQQTFTGEWDVLAGDEVVFRVQAETQGEANQKAREWMLGRSREFLQQHEGQEISTRPRYA